MGYYLLLYYDGEPESEQAQWDDWDKEIGNTLVNGGTAGTARAVTGDEAFNVNGHDVTGYRIIKADNLEEAIEISKGAPPIHQGGRAEVYQVEAMVG